MYVGDLLPHKNIGMFVVGFARFLKDHPASLLKLVLCGRMDPGWDTLEKEAEELGHKSDTIGSIEAAMTTKAVQDYAEMNP